jgi:hypothetical protein
MTDSILYLRTVGADHRSHGGFQWPREVGAEVVAPDWRPDNTCGGGLHGLPWGEGRGSLLCSDKAAVWQVVRASGGIDLRGKHKFERCTLEFSGGRDGAVAYILAHGGAGRAVAFATITAGYGGTATAGDSGTATAGDSGTATAGHGGTATAGHGGTATAGGSSKATAGNYGTATAGDSGKATAGHGGTATAGYGGTATAGYGGTATAGDSGTATAGDSGTATAGYGGTATAGDSGTLCIKYWSGNRSRIAIAYVGEHGIKPDVAYRLDAIRNFIAAGK